MVVQRPEKYANAVRNLDPKAWVPNTAGETRLIRAPRELRRLKVSWRASRPAPSESLPQGEDSGLAGGADSAGAEDGRGPSAARSRRT